MKKNKMFYPMLVVLIAFSLVLTACGSSATEAPDVVAPDVEEAAEESTGQLRQMKPQAQSL